MDELMEKDDVVVIAWFKAVEPGMRRQASIDDLI